MLKQFPLIRRLPFFVTTIALGLQASSSYAGAFSLYGEVNGRNAGNYAAGAAVDAEDASTLFYNPAGLVYLKGRQLVASGTMVKAKAKLSDDAYTYLNDASTTVSLSGLSTSEMAAIPAIFYANNVSNKLTWGIGVFAPFGLSTDWGESSNARYAATLSKLEVIDVSPALGIKLNKNLSFGAAFDMQFAKVDFNSVAALPGVPSADSISTNSGTSIGLGAHFGLLYQTYSGTRFGLNYQSSVIHHFNGSSTLKGQLADGSSTSIATSDNLFSDPISMPAQISFSSLHPMNEKLTISTTIAYTQWSVFQNITLHNVVGLAGAPLDVVVSENFKDTWRIASGAKYLYSDKIAFRMGLGYDQTPTNNTDRSLRLPDTDRVALAAGVHYQMTKKIGADFGWTHFFMKKTQIDNTTISSSNNIYVNAGVKSNVDIVAAQMTWQIS